MAYDPRIHHRRSIRLKGYDYSSPGFYFVTMNIQGRLPLLGEIRDGRMILSKAGRIAYWAWKELPKHYPHVRLDAWCLMPDHVHGIIVILDGSRLGGSSGLAQDTSLPGLFLPPGSGPVHETRPPGDEGVARLGGSSGLAQDTSLPGPFLPPAGKPAQETRPYGVGGEPPPGYEPAQETRPYPLSEVIRAFKSFSARRINALRGTPGVAVWQRDYYERIIRDDGALERIRRYIIENPARWWRLRNSV